MSGTTLPDHPLRYELSNELHARPFPELKAPCRAAFLAIKKPNKAIERDRAMDRKHLTDLLDRHGVAHPAPDANHYSGQLGRGFLNWEMHTEFVTYTIFADSVAETPFDAAVFSIFPKDWLADAPGTVLTSALVRVEEYTSETDLDNFLTTKIPHWFVPESLAMSRVIDDEAIIAGDFRIDEAGHVRFAVLTKPYIGLRRLGRIVQRLLEIETYKTASMLTLPISRTVSHRVAYLDLELTEIVQQMAKDDGDDIETLNRLLIMAAEIEFLSSSTAFRFGAAGAYEAIVNRRISVLREERFHGRQLFGEFMTRRYDPAMRTCRSAQERLQDLSARAERAANLLRTRVDVAAAEQNHEVLIQMDRRAALQLRLQETVEGLSVVAISYYAVSLAGYLLTPVAYQYGYDKSLVHAVVTLPVVAIVFAASRLIHKRIAD
ncbi:hypothetical protein A9Q96_15070 [Rhodobacterales bacterium 52_120_T64]|nr:hypothetical protein A9Q96_15070 [Rhodobacterales bacterium 52_120_T64]